jgi:hypothetical protein
MAQVRGKLCWRRVKKITGIEIELDFEHPILNPVPLFIDMLLRAHRMNFHGEKPFVLLVAEAETLDKVTENINLVESLNRLEGINAALTCPQGLDEKGGDVIYNGQKVTVIFLDINNDVLLKIAKRHNIGTCGCQRRLRGGDRRFKRPSIAFHRKIYSLDPPVLS